MEDNSLVLPVIIVCLTVISIVYLILDHRERREKREHDERRQIFDTPLERYSDTKAERLASKYRDDDDVIDDDDYKYRHERYRERHEERRNGWEWLPGAVAIFAVVDFCKGLPVLLLLPVMPFVLVIGLAVLPLLIVMAIFKGLSSCCFGRSWTNC